MNIGLRTSDRVKTQTLLQILTLASMHITGTDFYTKRYHILCGCYILLWLSAGFASSVI